MDVVTALAGDTSSHEVPECNPPVITTNSEHCTASVELGYECLASRVQYPVIVLRVARIEGSEELQVHPFLWDAILFLITINNWASLEVGLGTAHAQGAEF